MSITSLLLLSFSLIFNVFQLFSEEDIEKIIIGKQGKTTTAGEEQLEDQIDVNKIKASPEPKVKSRKLEKYQRIFKTENRFLVFQQFSEAKIEQLLKS